MKGFMKEVKFELVFKIDFDEFRYNLYNLILDFYYLFDIVLNIFKMKI